MERYPSPHPDKLLLQAPDFQPLWERAFDTWKDYVVEKEKAGKKMATYESKNKRQPEKEKDKDKPQLQEEDKDESPSEENKSQRSEEREEVRSATSSEAEPEGEDWDSLSPRERFLKKQALKKGKAGKSPKKEEEEKEVKNRHWDGKYSKKDL